MTWMTSTWWPDAYAYPYTKGTPWVYYPYPRSYTKVYTQGVVVDAIYTALSIPQLLFLVPEVANNLENSPYGRHVAATLEPWLENVPIVWHIKNYIF